MKQVLLKALNIIKGHIIQILQNSSNTIDPNKVGKNFAMESIDSFSFIDIRIIRFYPMMLIRCIMDDFESMHRK